MPPVSPGFLIVLLLAQATPEPALGPGAPPAAEQRYQVGKQLYLQGDYAGDAREFGVAAAMLPDNARLAYNLARSEERAGHLEAAVEAYERYLRLAPQAEDHAAVETILKQLRTRISESMPAVVMASEPAGAEVRVDGEAASRGTTPLTVKLAPGPHRVRFSLEGFDERAEVLTVKAGADNELRVELVASDAGALRPWLGWGGIGLGAAGLALGVVYDLKARDTVDESEGLTESSKATWDDLQHNLDVQQAVSWTGFVAGGLLLATGVTILLWPEEEGGATARLDVGPGTLGGTVRW